jgi:tRNA(Ile)-lysidine synthase
MRRRAGAHYIALAHHADDQAETVLLALLRGSGPAGLAAMPVAMPFGRGLLLRPLLDVPRAALAEWAHAQKVQWIDDPANRDSAIDRVWLRRQVLPALQARWPEAARTAGRAAGHLHDAGELMAQLAQIDLERICAEGGAPGVDGLLALERTRARNLLYHWLAVETGHPPDSGTVERVLDEVAGAGEDRQPALVWAGVRLRRHGGRLLIDAGEGSWQPGVFPWPDPSRPLELPGNGRLLGGAGNGTWCPERLRSGLEVRYREGGERFHDGRHRRRLKEWLRNTGIPPWQRERLPLLYLEGRLAGVAGHLLDPEFRADSVAAGWHIRWERPESVSDTLPD